MGETCVQPTGDQEFWMRPEMKVSQRRKGVGSEPSHEGRDREGLQGVGSLFEDRESVNLVIVKAAWEIVGRRDGKAFQTWRME